MNSPARVLMVDDEQRVRFTLGMALTADDLVCDQAESGEEALELLASQPYDLVVTDIRMGPVSGLDLLSEIRRRWPGTVVILLTGYASVDSAVQALRRGAHNYLTKPVSVEELRAAVREGLATRREMLHQQKLLAILREGILELSGENGPEEESLTESNDDSRWQRVGDLVIDRMKYTVSADGNPVDLTPTEFRLLLCLAENQEQVCAYRDLARQVYGHTASTPDAKRLIMPHVSNLRQKLRRASSCSDLIQNVRGVGYTIASR
jgi:DNA-binding response OmpR family regulator